MVCCSFLPTSSTNLSTVPSTYLSTYHPTYLRGDGDELIGIHEQVSRGDLLSGLDHLIPEVNILEMFRTLREFVLL